MLRALFALFDASPLAVFAEDRTGRVQLWNPAAEQIFGWTAAEVLGQPLPTIPVEKSGEAHTLLMRAFSGTAMSGHETQRLRKDGTLIDVSIACAPVRDGEGTVVGSLAVIADISARKKQEAEQARMQAAMRRAETMSTMGTLIAGVAHEVRNPLFGMTATLDAFGARFGDREEYQRYFGHLRGEMDRLSRLMKDLLEYGKPTEPELEVCALEDVIASAVSACRPLAEKSSVRLEITQTGGLPKLKVDTHRLGQVLQNLIENAIQHSKPNTTVRIEANPTSSGRVNCRVLDEGTGFRSEDLPRVFDPFFTRRRGGTGLGLSIVQRIVEQHGGTVEATNRLGGGAVVCISLPVAQGNT
ncbi:MAG: PAS domain S-box protein [Deltaproteobacteria bacterium]|nr:PAS domain S-box protein [Deltaproteobacteria bacterium]